MTDEDQPTNFSSFGRFGVPRRTPAEIKDILLTELASIVHDIAPPDGQRRIAALMDQLVETYKRSETDAG